MKGGRATEWPSCLDEFMWRERFSATDRACFWNICRHIATLYPVQLLTFTDQLQHQFMSFLLILYLYCCQTPQLVQLSSIPSDLTSSCAFIVVFHTITWLCLRNTWPWQRSWQWFEVHNKLACIRVKLKGDPLCHLIQCGYNDSIEPTPPCLSCPIGLVCYQS